MRRHRAQFRILLACLLLTAAGDAGFPAPNQRPRIPYDVWPQTRFAGIRILYAAHPSLAAQGFAGASAADFERTIIVFPSFPPGAIFTMKDCGFGPVIKDLKIVFLDSDWRVLREDIMQHHTGESIAPARATIAIEGLPETPIPRSGNSGH